MNSKTTATVLAGAALAALAGTALAGAALAQSTAGGGGMGDILVTLMPIALIFLVFYVLLIRPQQKRLKEHKAMVDGLRRGDRIITGGGLVGMVVRVTSDEDIMVELCEGVRVRVIRATISGILAPKSEPAGSSTTPKANEPKAGEALEHNPDER